MTLNLPIIKPNLSSTQVSRWLTRDNTELSIPSSPQKNTNGHVTIFFESTRNTTNNFFHELTVSTLSSNSEYTISGNTTDYGQTAPILAFYNPATNTTTVYGYDRTGNSASDKMSIGLPNTTQVDISTPDGTNNGLNLLRITKSTGNIAYQASTGSMSGAYSSINNSKIVYESGSPTVIYTLYRSSVSRYVGVVFRFDSTLNTLQSAYFDANFAGSQDVYALSGADIPGATNRLHWAGQHGSGGRIIGAISGGMGAGALADFSEYGGGMYLDMVGPTSGTTFFAVGYSNSGAGVYSAVLSKHDASSLSSAPTTRLLASPVVGSYSQYNSVVWDETNGFVYAVGYGNGSGDSNAGLIAKYNSSTMTLVWQRLVNFQGANVSLSKITLDSDKNLIIAGTMDSQNFVMRYDNSGPTGSYSYIPNNNTYQTITFSIEAGNFTASSPTTTASSRSYTNFAGPGISFGTSFGYYSKQGTNPVFTAEKVLI